MPLKPVTSPQAALYVHHVSGPKRSKVCPGNCLAYHLKFCSPACHAHCCETDAINCNTVPHLEAARNLAKRYPHSRFAPCVGVFLKFFHPSKTPIIPVNIKRHGRMV